MRTCATAGGGVMFIPDEIETQTKTQSYKDFLEEVPAKEKPKAFGKKSKNKEKIKKAA